MNPKQSMIILGFHGGVAVVVVLAATLLCFHGSLDASAVTAIYGAAIGLAGGASSALGSLSSAVNGKATVSDATLRQAISGGQYADTPHEPVIPPGPNG